MEWIILMILITGVAGQTTPPPSYVYPDCVTGEFKCGNGRCISEDLKCNGENDCRDNTDEAGCVAEELCGEFQFECHSGNVSCLELPEVCDSTPDCQDGSDEWICNQANCTLCQHPDACTPIQGTTGYRCDCPRGYRQINQTHCEEIDECVSTPWVCSQICHNTVGSYRCSCLTNYRLDQDSSGTCRAVSDIDPVIFFTNRYYIRRLSYDNSEYTLIDDEFQVLVGLDFDYAEEKLYTFDHLSGRIERLNLDGTGRETIIDEMFNGENIAIDWVARLVYFTDWGFNSYIGRIGTDGSEVTYKPRIVDSNIVWPNGITIDFTSEKIFWTDAHLNFIAYADLDGSNMFTLSGPPADSVSHPFDIAIFEDWIYWTEWNFPSVHRAKKFSGQDYEKLRELGVRPYSIIIYHPLEQINGTNPCGQNNGGCSHLCLIKQGGMGYTCACPEHFNLGADGMTCEAVCDNVYQHFLCEDKSKCIPSYWMCDNNVDCLDGSDEPDTCDVQCDPRQFQCDDEDLTCLLPNKICNGVSDCGNDADEQGCDDTICHEWEFRCNSGSCIHEKGLCDGFEDCEDGSDELVGTCNSTMCAQGLFKCDNGLCIPDWWVCDLDNDCGDHSDEPESCYEQTCEEGWYSCTQSYRCVPSWATCDGLNHCRDNSDEDEELCGMDCEAGYWRCDNGYCIPDRWLCNFRDECGDRSDEGTICVDRYRNCTEFEFRCQSNRCVTRYQVCDQEPDCEDADDEEGCEAHTCLTGFFQCVSGHCINEELRCDGEVHCPDMSDEDGCPTRYPMGRYCFNSEFTCNNTLCIDNDLVCDYIDDCGDGSDETVEACKSLPCDEDVFFRCRLNAHCFPRSVLCDGEDDCMDGTDEDLLDVCDPTVPKCDDDEFTCGDGGCIPFDDVCDGVAHCEDFSDETCEPGTCEDAPCEQECTEIGESYACHCSVGYRPSQEFHKCIDVNECAESNPCIQICVNGEVSLYSCSCVDGFDLVEPNQCFPSDGSSPDIVKTYGDEIRIYNQIWQNHTQTWKLPFSWIESLDYSYEESTMFLLDSLRKVLIRTDFENSNPMDIHLRGVHRPRTLAVDFVGRNVYWTDLGNEEVQTTVKDLPRISVIDFEGLHQQTVARFHQGLPKGLAVSARRGLMYWFSTDGSMGLPVIESAWMNGFRRQEIVTRGLVSVDSIAIDYNHDDVVYFADTVAGLHSMNYDGSFVTRIGGEHDIDELISSMDVFGSSIYWTDADDDFRIYTMDKLGRTPWNLVTKELLLVQDLKLLHPLRSDLTIASSPCIESPCSYLCLLTPTSDGIVLQRPPFACGCPDGLYLLPDLVTCQEGPGPACLGAENGGCSHNCSTGSQGEPICECPPGLRLSNDRRVCVAEDASCRPGFFTCTNSVCIPESWKCDVDNDCGDNSDELYATCYDHVCEDNEFRCNNGRCILEIFVCDFDNDCRDGSDEILEMCDHPECPADTFQCENYQCIDPDFFCDGFQDCNDISDETNCTHLPFEPCPSFFGIEFERCPDNNICIPSVFICDGENDCVDNSDEDEAFCSNRTCGELQYQCGTGNCIPATWHCDNFQDCFDGSDEPSDCDTGTCLPNFFRCANGGPCIPNQWLCDLDNDCGDNSDEMGEICEGTPPPCLGDSYQCAIGRPGVGRCIPPEYVCDGVSDCEDAEDEFLNCPPPAACTTFEFQCGNNLCIPQQYHCDHDNDCGDGTDEGSFCEYEPCRSNQFTCRNGRCITILYVCDGQDDCRDNSDETHESCAVPTCPPGDFTCANGDCLNSTLVCDGFEDCSDNSDEVNCDRNECEEDLGMMCGQGCLDLPTGYECVCNENYTLNEDGQTCRDIDECRETPWVCNNFCENQPGSYLCRCAPGYTLSEASGTCRRDSPVEPYLFFTNRHYIRRLALDGSQYDLVKEGFELAVAFDVDLVDEKLFVLDVNREAIYRMNLDGSDQEAIIDEFVTDGEGLAVDWIGRKIYWVDRIKDVMEVAELDGRLRKTLLHEGLNQPRAIVVDPLEGYVFWTDFGLIPYIGRQGMDGRGQFIRIHSDKILFPFGLSIDYDTRRLFWVDAHLDYIGYSDFDGENFNIVPSQGDETYFRPFAVTVFEEYMYWTDWSELTVFRAHKFTGENRTQLVQLERHRPYDVHVYHPNLQRLDIPNPCGNNNGECSHLCLLSEGGGYSCACPDGFTLNTADNKSCTANCGSYQFLCADQTKCIVSYYECDGMVDCADGSDEHGSCPHPVCTRGFFHCDLNTCLNPLQICNGLPDCLDGADEDLCNDNETMTQCHPWEFRCDTGQCIPSVFKCDDFIDCPYADDEGEICRTEEACDLGYFHCDNGLCIPESWYCDLDNDCGDNSDEPHRECQMRPCNQNWFHCESNYRCIPPYGLCDGLDQCRDNSDEANCPDMTCGPGISKCDDQTCLPDWLFCDFRRHCRDGSDEMYCNYTNNPCSESEFRCDNNLCIQGVWVCDDFPNCPSGEDEVGCPVHVCNEGYHKCATTGFCLPPELVCDGIRDCQEADDEAACPTRFPNGHFCYRYQFECANHVCIEVGATCNGIDDCGDNSDEAPELCGNCDHPNLFLCNSGRCIADWEQCDGIPDCDDRSDEDMRCDAVCESNEMLCSSTGRCIPSEFFCDRYLDCGDDESQFCGYGRIGCDADTCDQNCVDAVDFSYCVCDPGYRANQIPASNGQRTCENINECEEADTCDQICTDYKGSYECTCLEGYQEVAPGRCNVTGPRPQLLYADGTELRFYNYNTGRAGVIVSGEGRIASVDVNNGYAYWTDTALKVIKRARIPFSEDEKVTSKIVVGPDSVNHPTGLSIDFQGGNIYWLDQADPSVAGTRGKRQAVVEDPTSTLKVATLTGGSQKTLLSGLSEVVGDIVVNPRRGVMYWYNLGAEPSIEWAAMNGDNRAVLVADELREPSGLTIDFAKDDNVYFCDRSLNSIEVMTWDGQNRRVLARSSALRQPLGLEVFESYLYWSTSEIGSFGALMKMDKRGDSIPTVEVFNLNAPGSPKMNHPLRYDLQQSPNPCDNNPCSSLCILSPSTEIEGQVRFDCECEDGDTYVDFNDKTICNKTAGGTEPPPTAPITPFDCQCVKSNGNCDVTTRSCRCYRGFTGRYCESEVEDCSGNGVLQADGSCRCLEGFSGNTCEKYSAPIGQSNGLIIVVIVVVVILVLVIIIVAAMYFRNSRRSSEPPAAVMYSNDDVKIPTSPEPLPLQFTNPNFATLQLEAEGKDSGLPNDYDEIPKKGSDVVALDMKTASDPDPEPQYDTAMKSFSPAGEGEHDTYNLVTKDPE